MPQWVKGLTPALSSGFDQCPEFKPHVRLYTGRGDYWEAGGGGGGGNNHLLGVLAISCPIIPWKACPCICQIILSPSPPVLAMPSQSNQVLNKRTTQAHFIETLQPTNSIATILCIPFLNVIQISTLVYTIAIVFLTLQHLSPSFPKFPVKLPTFCYHPHFSETSETMNNVKTT